MGGRVASPLSHCICGWWRQFLKRRDRCAADGPVACSHVGTGTTPACAGPTTVVLRSCLNLFSASAVHITVTVISRSLVPFLSSRLCLHVLSPHRSEINNRLNIGAEVKAPLVITTHSLFDSSAKALGNLVTRLQWRPRVFYENLSEVLTSWE